MERRFYLSDARQYAYILKLTQLGYRIDSTNFWNEYKLNISDDAYADSLLSESQYDVIISALNIDQMENVADTLDLIQKGVEEIKEEEEKSRTAEDVVNKYSNTVDSVNGTEGSASTAPQLPKPVDERLKITYNEPQPQKSFVTAEIVPPFLDNIEKLAGAITNGYSSTRENEQLYIRPKPEVVAKLFVLPEWSNNLDNSIYGWGWRDDSIITTDFALTQVQEQEAEKYQIIETFGNDILYFYGKRPTVYSFSGNLLNTTDYQWRNNFYEYYKNSMRGTKCVENKTRAYMLYDDVIVEGYILNLSMSMNAQETKVVPFTFAMFITNQTKIHIEDLDKVTPALPDYQYEKQLFKTILQRYKEFPLAAREDAIRKLQADREAGRLQTLFEYTIPENEDW